MRQLPSDKYNVAWFKLAEFVARGERERALGLYNLLAHSFQNRAIAYQLKGDILLSFNDIKQACDCYVQAALAYKDDAQIIEAAAVYEHLISINQNSIEYITELINLYYFLTMTIRLMPYLNKLCYLLIEQKYFDSLEMVVAEWESKLERNNVIALYKNITLELMRKKVEFTKINIYLEKTIFLLIECENNVMLQPFLASLEAFGQDYYTLATQYMRERSIQL